MSQKVYLKSTQVPSLIQVQGIWAHLNPGYNIHMPSPSKLYLTLINVHIFASHINPCNVSPPSRSWKYPQIHPVTISNTWRFEDVQLTSTKVLSHLHLSSYFTYVPSQASIQVHRSPSHFHQGCVWIPSSSHHLNLRPYISISPPSWWHLTSIQVHKLHFSSTQAPSQAHPGLEMYVSPPSRSAKLHLRFKQPPSQTHPGFKICLNSMQVLSHLNPDSNILASLPSMYSLTSIRVARFTSQFHPAVDIYVSPPSRSLPSISVDL